jgi:hypothetical protein
MRAANQIHLENSKSNSTNYDGLIMLSYAAFTIVFLALIYFDSTARGTAIGDFASMSAFP